MKPDPLTDVNNAVWLAAILFIALLFALAWVAAGDEGTWRAVQGTWGRP